MNLLVDMSEQDLIRLSLFGGNEIITKEFRERNRELLFCIDNLLHEQRLSKVDIKGIAVVVGEGSFTSTRIAVTMANTFGYVLNIPVLGVVKDEAKPDAKLIERISWQPICQYILATYSGEPNIGKKV